MGVIKFKYDAYQTWFLVILLSGLIIFCLYAIKTDSPGDSIWELMGPMTLAFVAMLAYVCRKFFFPLLKNKIALELDKEKLQFFITGRIIYWSEVKSIDYTALYYGGWAIIFVFKNGDDNVNISTKYIRGRDKSIYDSIQLYFKKYN